MSLTTGCREWRPAAADPSRYALNWTRFIRRDFLDKNIRDWLPSVLMLGVLRGVALSDRLCGIFFNYFVRFLLNKQVKFGIILTRHTNGGQAVCCKSTR